MRKEPVCEGMDQMELTGEVKDLMMRLLKEGDGQSTRAGYIYIFRMILRLFNIGFISHF
jgi:hypothetical protein